MSRAVMADIKYVYTRKWSDHAKIFKVVSFFLMKYRSGQIGDIQANMKHEVRRAWWLPLGEAAARLSYTGEKRMARRALRYLKSYPERLENPEAEG